MNKAKKDFAVSILGYKFENKKKHSNILILKLYDCRHKPEKEYYIKIDTTNLPIMLDTKCAMIEIKL